MSEVSPSEIAAVLRSVASGAQEPRFPEVKKMLEDDWRRIAVRRFPKLGDDFQDAIQDTWSVVLRADKIAQVKDVVLVQSWARQVFINNVYDLLKWRWPDRHRDLHQDDHENDDVLRSALPDPSPNPEEEACARERLGAILELIGGNLIARLRAIDGLPDKVIAGRLGLEGRDGVAGRLKRFRIRLRDLLETLDAVPSVLPGASAASVGARRRDDA